MRVPNGFALFLRYQTLAERQYRRAVEEFDRLKSLRGELPNEAIEEFEPVETQPDAPLQNKPARTPRATRAPAPGPAPAPDSDMTFPLLVVWLPNADITRKHIVAAVTAMTAATAGLALF